MRPGASLKRTVHVESPDCCSAAGRGPDYCGRVVCPREVVDPEHGARVKYRDDRSGFGISRDLTRALGKIARTTRERQIGQFVGSAGCSRDDVLEMKAIATEGLWRLAVLATFLRPLLDPRPRAARRRHQLAARSATAPPRIWRRCAATRRAFSSERAETSLTKRRSSFNSAGDSSPSLW
jgi:hypothetical protein